MNRYFVIRWACIILMSFNALMAIALFFTLNPIGIANAATAGILLYQLKTVDFLQPNYTEEKKE